MMIKVALLLLALAAPMISATRDCPWAARKVLAKCGDECSDRTPKGLQDWAQGCCAPCPRLKCKKAWRKLKKDDRCENCDQLKALALDWKCPNDGGYGHGGGYGGGGGGDGYDYSTCDLYPLYDGHNNYGPCDPKCNPHHERKYDYGDISEYSDLCKKNSVTKKHEPNPYSYIEKTHSYGYGPGYDNNLCNKAEQPKTTPEYLYARTACPGKYEPLCPSVEPYACPICEACNYETCPSINYDDCLNKGYTTYKDATLASSGETTNETVQTLSWVLIAIAAALFLASIAFCAVGRRERKAHAAENVNVNALA